MPPGPGPPSWLKGVLLLRGGEGKGLEREEEGRDVEAFPPAIPVYASDVSTLNIFSHQFNSTLCISGQLA